MTATAQPWPCAHRAAELDTAVVETTNAAEVGGAARTARAVLPALPFERNG